MNNATKMIVESLLFVASEPLTARQIHAMIPEKKFYHKGSGQRLSIQDKAII